MLMSMEHEFRLCPLEVLVECREPHVHVILAIVDQSRGVMGDETSSGGVRLQNPQTNSRLLMRQRQRLPRDMLRRMINARF